MNEQPNQQTNSFHHTIGIAGHIDHGKTSLTKNLTGVDTDRLKEEKERNISIELGFAPCVLPNGQTVGIVDVPGHERFIRQMIAGAAGIDLVLLVIAADEGIMPQTREHVDILRFLGIQKGIITLTKIDSVEEEWLAMVKEEVANWAQETFLADAPIVAVSNKTGEGMQELLHTIEKEISGIPQRSSAAPFRMPIDRAFTVKGAGTVVTGTIYEGTVVEGDSLQLLPDETMLRVRQIHVHHQQVKQAAAGQRAALNIVGTREVERGMTLTSPGYFQATSRLDLHFTMLGSLDFSLKQRTRVRLHMGTAEVIGKLVFFDRNEMKPGEETVCQLQLEESVVTKKGDPLILRRLSPVTTLGGGYVVDPYAARHRFGEETVRRLNRLAEDSPEEQLIQYLEQAEFATEEELAHQLAMNIEGVRALLKGSIQSGDVKLLGREESSYQDPTQQGSPDQGAFRQESSRQTFVLLTRTLTAWEERLTGELRNYHATYPLRVGAGKAAMKSSLFKNMPDKLWRYLVEETGRNEKIKESNDMIYLASHTPQYPQAQRESIHKALDALQQSGLTPPSWEALMREHGITGQLGSELKALLTQREEILPLTEEIYIDKKEWLRGVEKLRAESQPDDILTPALAKDILGLSRKYLIPFLESLDKYRQTKRTEAGREWLPSGSL